MNYYLKSTFSWSDVKPFDTVTILSFEVTDEIYSKAIKVAYSIAAYPVYYNNNGDLIIHFYPCSELAHEQFIFGFQPESRFKNNCYGEI